MPERNDSDPPDRPWERRDRDDRDDRPRRRRRDDYEDDLDRPRGPATNGMASTAVVLGLLALLTTIIGGVLILLGGWTALIGSLVLLVSGLLGLPAAICGGIGMTRPVKRGAATAGLLLGILGVLAGIGGLGYSLFASVTKVREAAARAKDSNNLKQISIAMHAYHDSNGRFPPAAPEGKFMPATAELSWRVYLLPYIEQPFLHQRFNMNQSWDSPTNRPLARERVPTYVSAADPPATVETRYRVFVGPGTLYDRDRPVRNFIEVTDGLSGTFFAVEAGEMVPWPQPKELPYDRTGPLPRLGVAERKGFLVAFADGSVRFVSETTSPDVIRGGIEPRDGRLFPLN